MDFKPGASCIRVQAEGRRVPLKPWLPKRKKAMRRKAGTSLVWRRRGTRRISRMSRMEAMVIRTGKPITCA